MTIAELLVLAHAQPGAAAALIAAAPAAAGVLQVSPATAYPRGALAYAWSAVVHAACVPGLLALTVLGVTLLGTGNRHGAGLLELDLLAVFGPIAAMAATLSLAARKVPIAALPGVGRLGGLVMVLAATAATVMLLDKLRILVVFHGSVWTLLAIAGGLFLVFKLGFGRLLGRTPRETPPTW